MNLPGKGTADATLGVPVTGIHFAPPETSLPIILLVLKMQKLR